MSTNITALSCLSQTSTYNRTNEGMLVALLIIATLAIGSLFSVAKAVGNRLLRSNPEVQRSDNVDQKSKTSEIPRDLNAARATANAIPTLYPKIKDSETNPELPNLQPQPPMPQFYLPVSLHDRARNHAAGLNAVHDWELSTADRIQRQKTRKLDRLPSSFDDGQKIQDIHAVLAWEEATMRRFRQEKMRRLERLSLVDRREGVSVEEQVGTAVRAWEGAAKRNVEREKGLNSVGEWELSQKKKRSQERADAEDDRPTVLWKAGSD